MYSQCNNNKEKEKKIHKEKQVLVSMSDTRTPIHNWWEWKLI
jgi:hypothetical protein